MDDAPLLDLPALEPVPVEGCDVCGALARQRTEARDACDWRMSLDYV